MYLVHVSGIIWQAFSWVKSPAQIIAIYFLTVLEYGSPRSRHCQVWILPKVFAWFTDGQLFTMDPDDDPRHTCLYVDIHCLKIQDIGSRPIFMTLFYPITS